MNFSFIDNLRAREGVVELALVRKMGPPERITSLGPARARALAADLLRLADEAEEQSLTILRNKLNTLKTDQEVAEAEIRIIEADRATRIPSTSRLTEDVVEPQRMVPRIPGDQRL